MALRHAALLDLPHLAERDPHQGAGRRLLEQGVISPWQFFFARSQRVLWDASLTDILIAKGWVTEPQALGALGHEVHAPVIDLEQAPPDFRLTDVMPPETCLKYAAIPWIELNGELVIATSRPEFFERLRPHLPSKHRLPQMVLAPEGQIQAVIARLHRGRLIERCETRVNLQHSCRGWDKTLRQRLLSIGFTVILAVAIFSIAPDISLQSLVILALGFLTIGMGMKAAALTASRLATPLLAQTHRKSAQRLPQIAVLVPLYKETEIAGALIRRLCALTYPRALLDVVLILEEKDPLTQATIAKTDLPAWIRVVTVPEGRGLTTKPRAMNYALDFCRGDIIGIWDAEDAPNPNQLETIAAHFSHAAPDVACVQGILDYYNPDTNWISRCFTLEYSIWFRVVLRGMARMGAPIPLGGTTLFVRRTALEKIGRWDAHNVTEDADLGIRLTRFGYRTELSLTVTQEEANCRFHPWIRQRSRWLKGYMVTYLVHMRHPRQLLRELGWGKFIGFNVILLAALMQFLLAPVIWCFWLLAFGAHEPLGLAEMPPALISAAMVILGSATLLDIVLTIQAMRGQKRLRLIPWVAGFLLYFPMATLAAYKALFELIVKPYFWDKTAHGQTPEGQAADFSAIST